MSGNEEDQVPEQETTDSEKAESAPPVSMGPPTRRMLEDDLDAREPARSEPPHFETEPHIPVAQPIDPEVTLDLSGDALETALRDDSQSPLAHTVEAPTAINQGTLGRDHLKGLLEALIFASDKPLRAADLARSAAAPIKEVKLLLAVLKADYASRGIQLDEVAGGWIFRTHVQFAPFVRDMAAQKPVRLSRAQVETLAILAYRQPITRPEIDEVRGVDCGATLKLLLERDLVKILGKKDEPGRPLLYGTTPHFLEFFGLNSLKDLPTLREYTELNEDSKRVVERELGDTLDAAQPEAPAAQEEAPPDSEARDTVEPTSATQADVSVYDREDES